MIWARVRSVVGSLILTVSSPASITLSADFTGTVIEVVEGDTLVVQRDTGTEAVRLQGIDCPESKQTHGEQATLATAAMVFGKTVTVKDLGRDRYHRTMGEVTLSDGRNLNQELVRSGACWWLPRSSGHPNLQTLEAEARSAKRGLWADPNPIPPWEWRTMKKRYR